LEHPIDYPIDAVRIPSTTRILGRDDKGINLSAHLQGIQWPITAYAIEVVTTEAGTMQEEDDGRV
jgi:hypothetical protein